MLFSIKSLKVFNCRCAQTDIKKLIVGLILILAIVMISLSIFWEKSSKLSGSISELTECNNAVKKCACLLMDDAAENKLGNNTKVPCPDDSRLTKQLDDSAECPERCNYKNFKEKFKEAKSKKSFGYCCLGNWG